MQKSQPTKKNKPCEKLLKAIGDYWTLALIEHIAKSQRRFCELERLLPNINPVTLTSRLKEMEQIGLLERNKDSSDKIAVLYTLTKQGLGLLPIALEIRKFAEKFVHKK